MNISKKLDGHNLTIALEGRLDTMTAPELESALHPGMDDAESLVLDLKDLHGISSAGLRVLLAAYKYMNKQGYMIVRNVNPEIMDIFRENGFLDILTIEN